jgi:hypothetical protein
MRMLPCLVLKSDHMTLFPYMWEYNYNHIHSHLLFSWWQYHIHKSAVLSRNNFAFWNSYTTIVFRYRWLTTMSKYKLVSYFMSILQNQNEFEILFNFWLHRAACYLIKDWNKKNLEYAKSFQDTTWFYFMFEKAFLDIK